MEPAQYWSTQSQLHLMLHKHCHVWWHRKLSRDLGGSTGIPCQDHPPRQFQVLSQVEMGLDNQFYPGIPGVVRPQHTT